MCFFVYYIYIYIYIYTHIYTHIHILYMHTYIIHTYIHTYIQGLDNETETLANIVLEISWLYLRSLVASLH